MKRRSPRRSGRTLRRTAVIVSAIVAPREIVPARQASPPRRIGVVAGAGVVGGGGGTWGGAAETAGHATYRRNWVKARAAIAKDPGVVTTMDWRAREGRRSGGWTRKDGDKEYKIGSAGEGQRLLESCDSGKTMIARLLAELLHMVGVLKENKVVEVQQTDLVGEFVGHIGPRTRIKIKEAKGGILFVDEAYRLMPVQSGTDKDYNIEALEDIMSVMDADKVVVIFAGYSEPMQHILGANEGFCQRVNQFFHFEDFSTKEIAQIVHTKLEEQKSNSLIHGFKLAKDCTADTVA